MNKRRVSGLGSLTGRGWGASQRFDKDVKEEKMNFIRSGEMNHGITLRSQYSIKNTVIIQLTFSEEPRVTGRKWLRLIWFLTLQPWFNHVKDQVLSHFM